MAALGVVYGDIGTSPLYAVRESFSGHFGIAPVQGNVLGVLSLITWSLVLIVSVKYLGLVLKADNKGEGGILAMTALIDPRQQAPEPQRRRPRPSGRRFLLLIGLFGAALLYGDGVLTPAISVLSAVEGLGVWQPTLSPFVVPLTVALLVGLFLVQRIGTARVGSLFGPVMVIWFVTLALLGAKGILLKPGVLAALDPRHALTFLLTGGSMGFLVLGAVFLVVTGAEALYADMGHFGRRPIRLAWFALAFPALLLNYFGQGALVLHDPATIRSPFYLLAPSWALVPLILLSTLATIIASQAVITGVYSLTMQAVQLGHWPRTDIRHTSELEYGQIYVPPANWTLMVLTVVVVLVFGSSSALAAAYGVAIVTTMIVTTLLLFVVAPERWGWNPWLARGVLTFFLLIELGFFGANLTKVHEGGWVPLAFAGVLFVLVLAWQTGRRILGRRISQMLVPLDRFLDDLARAPVQRVPGAGVYMTGNPDFAPPPLIKNLEHQKTLHERVLLLTITTERVPRIPPEARVEVQTLEHGFHRVTARYGFMETPNLLRVLDRLKTKGLELPLQETTFFLGRERLMTRQTSLRVRLPVAAFSFMARNSQRATEFFNIPPDRVVEVGTQIEV